MHRHRPFILSDNLFEYGIRILPLMPFDMQVCNFILSGDASAFIIGKTFQDSLIIDTSRAVVTGIESLLRVAREALFALNPLLLLLPVFRIL